MREVFLWWGVLLFIGIAWLPLTHTIFRRFRDKGWLFSKTLGLFLSGWLLWALNCTGLIPFTQNYALFAVAIPGIFCYFFYAILTHSRKMKAKDGSGREFPEEIGGLAADYFGAIRLILLEEVLFLALFALSVYVIGFKPEAYGTEKFMDYAFLTSMMRSVKMPFADPWYGGEPINYYYGGQYYAAFLTKFTAVTAGEGYNLMRALVTTASFMLPFSLVYQLMHSKMENTKKRTGATHPNAPFMAGLMGGIAVAFCGNFHYVIYGIILPLINKAKGVYYSYWFPDSTRYIGYSPDLPDKTIHEFPAYSSVLGDLHAHYVNILFVVTVTAIVYGWAEKQDPRRQKRFPFLGVEVILCGMMTGVFRWTNYWDFPIYFVVCGSIFFFVLLRSYRGEILKFIFMMLCIAAVMFGCGYVASLPFTLTFNKISSEVAFTHSHTLWYQLIVLWGLPCACLIGFIIRLIIEKRKRDADAPKALRKMRRMALPDLAVLMYGLCAAGLVFLPEVIYVVDIYSGSHYRANTMFKLSYQAFILFGMCMAYILVRAVVLGLDAWKEADAGNAAAKVPAGKKAAEKPKSFLTEESSEAIEEEGAKEEAAPEATAPEATALETAALEATAPEGAARDETADEDAGTSPAESGSEKKKGGKAGANVRIAAGLIGLFLLLLTGGYMIQSTYSWFGNIFDPSLRVHTDASVFVSEYFPTDFEAINFLNSTVEGQPVILEAPGDGYTDYERVSVATGLPTVAGWRVHEWLWRGDVETFDERVTDVDMIYTAEDADLARELLARYGVKYIYVGSLERERYPDINEELLQSLGEVVFRDGDTYVIEVGAA